MTQPAAELVTVTIDGIAVQVPKAMTVIQAAEEAGIVIPRYCYHPAMSSPAQCRMCLVEVKGAPKLVPSCVQRVQDGMEVRTDSPAARKARRAVIEFLLVNHPLDCPICDAAGQCELQDYAFETGQLRTRSVDPKRVLGRDHVTPDVLYFADRCVLCTRCVRFMEEIAREPTLVVVQRGDRATIDTMAGELFEHPFSMNIVDVCPVGALVNEDFLFKPRAWDLDRFPSVCPGCAQGCNITLDTKENRVVRAKPRPHPEVNAFWMCDHGRKLLAGWVPGGERGERLEAPQIRDGDRLVAVSWPQALERAAEGLRQAGGPGRAIVSAAAANESLYALRKVMQALGFAGGAFRVPTGPTAVLEGFPKLQLRAERVPNAVGAALLGFRRSADLFADLRGRRGALLVLGDPLHDAPADFGRDAAFYLYAGSVASPAARNAHVLLPVTTFAEMDGTFTNFEGRVQRFTQALTPPGMARPAWVALSALSSRMGSGAMLDSAAEAFAALAAEFEPFRGMTYETLGFGGRITEAAEGAAAVTSGGK
ncbi:MAG: (2Fe-2S)-binding protein [Gemmatimonadetes bacterium]|nr:(2Fe-2S)-binding protein [Gemmatimonadota bacterium]